MFTFRSGGQANATHRARRKARPGRSTCRVALEQLEDRLVPSADVIVQWNQALVAAELALKTDQGHATRAQAIMSLAAFNAVDAIEQTYGDYYFDDGAPRHASPEAAAAQASHDVLAVLFSTQQATWDNLLAQELAVIPSGQARQEGIAVGQEAAQSILALRANDHADAPYIPYTPGTGPAAYQLTPPSFGPPILTQWPFVTPFGMTSGSQFRAPPPPALTSAEFTAAYDEVKSIGAANSTTRTALQTEIAHFWDMPAFAQWNEITQNVASSQPTTLAQDARLFALVNMAMADATIAQFDTKYTYNYVRPVTAIRNGDHLGNPDVSGDPSWTPLIVTPAHPSYQSGHANTGTAAATILADFFGPSLTFSVGSHNAFIPAGLKHTWTTFEAAAQENALSRIYGGIHWRFDAVVGMATGRAIGDYIFHNFLRPHRYHHHHHDHHPSPGGAPSGANFSSALAQLLQQLGVFSGASTSTGKGDGDAPHHGTPGGNQSGPLLDRGGDNHGSDNDGHSGSTGGRHDNNPLDGLDLPSWLSALLNVPAGKGGPGV
jgi:membrane-associated phospholipid phosphatase